MCIQEIQQLLLYFANQITSEEQYSSVRQKKEYNFRKKKKKSSDFVFCLLKFWKNTQNMHSFNTNLSTFPHKFPLISFSLLLRGYFRLEIRFCLIWLQSSKCGVYLRYAIVQTINRASSFTFQKLCFQVSFFMLCKRDTEFLTLAPY